jgi:hypothetical protein
MIHLNLRLPRSAARDDGPCNTAETARHRILAKLYDDANAEKPDPKVEAQAAALAKKNGFASVAEYDDVSTNIMMIMSGIDPQIKKFTEPPELIKHEIAALKADKSVSEAEKKEGLAELEAAQDRKAHSVQGKHRTRAEVLRPARTVHAGAGFNLTTCGLEIRLVVETEQWVFSRLIVSMARAVPAASMVTAR